MWLKYYFMEKPASPSLEGCLLSKKTRASDLHPEILSSYFEVVHYLFVAYATDNIIDHLIKKLDCYQQASVIFLALWAKRPSTNRLRCGIVYKEKRVKSLFFKVSDGLACNTFAFIESSTRAILTNLPNHINTLIRIVDKNAKTWEWSKNRLPRSAVEPNKLYTRPVMFGDNDDERRTS